MKRRGISIITGLAAAAITFAGLYAVAPEKMGAGSRHHFSGREYGSHRGNYDCHAEHEKGAARSENSEK